MSFACRSMVPMETSFRRLVSAERRVVVADDADISDTYTDLEADGNTDTNSSFLSEADPGANRISKYEGSGVCF